MHAQRLPGAYVVAPASFWSTAHLYLSFPPNHEYAIAAITSTNVLKIRNWRTLLLMCPADVSCSLTRWQHLCAWNEVMTAILKVWRQIENPTPSIDAIYSRNNPAKFHPDPIWNDGALVFWNSVNSYTGSLPFTSAVCNTLMFSVRPSVCPSAIKPRQWKTHA